MRTGPFSSSRCDLTLGGVSLPRTRIETGLLPLLAERGALVLCKAGFSERSGGLDFPIGHVDPVGRQLRVLFWSLCGAHRDVSLFDRHRRATREVRISLQLRQFAACFRSAWGFEGRARTGREQRGRQGRNDQRLAEMDGLDGIHCLSPELRCISSIRVLVLRFISVFTALA